MSGLHFPETHGRQLSDDQRNQLWELRYEACEDGESCVDEPGMSHHLTCPRAED